MDSTRGSTAKEESKRQERADKGIVAWMQRTDVDTLHKALDGKIIDFKASAKLYGSLVSDPARMMAMGSQGKLMGEQLAAATDLMNMAFNSRGLPVSREDIENAAMMLIAKQHEEEMKRNQTRREIR
jgi:hypothetical protein